MNIHLCGACKTNTEVDSKIMCVECKCWIHYACSRLPPYMLLCLVSTNRKFTCETCSYVKYPDPDKTQKISETIEKQKKSMSLQAATAAKDKHSTPPQQAHPTTATTTTPRPQEETVQTDHTLTVDQTQVHQVNQSQTPQAPGTQGSTVSTTTYNSSSTVPDNTGNTQTGQYESPVETRICRYYKRGFCNHGQECRFKHPKPCNRLMNHGIKGKNGCKLGRSCGMFHPTICRNSLRKHMCLVESCRYMHVRGTKRQRETQASSSTTSAQQTEVRVTAPRPAPPPLHPASSTAGSEIFLGAVYGMRTDMGNLLKAMEAQTALLSNFLRDTTINKGEWPAHPPMSHPSPWLNTPLSH